VNASFYDTKAAEVSSHSRQKRSTGCRTSISLKPARHRTNKEGRVMNERKKFALVLSKRPTLTSMSGSIAVADIARLVFRLGKSANDAAEEPIVIHW
jgi:hypothetical protein